MNEFPDWLAHRAHANPGREALSGGGVVYSYRELNARADLAAGGLWSYGVRAGDRVAVLAGNSLELVVAVHAVWRLGAVLVPLNARLTPGELAWQLGDVEARILLHDGSHAGVAAEAANAAGITDVHRLGMEAAALFAPAETHGADAVACIMYTSGTTGEPKGAQITFGNLFASAAGSAFNLGVAPADRWLACMPLFHIGGLSIIVRSALYGTAAVVHESFDEERVASELRTGGVTMISVVATMLQRLLDADDAPAPPELRVVLVGGGPVPRGLLERAAGLGYPVVQTYGMTETASQLTTLSPEDALTHLGSAGKAIISARIRVDAADGEAGEIIVGGPVLSPGYFRRPEATAGVFRDGWFHTSDIGRQDEEGFLYVLDRRPDLIVSGGENVYPAEVEAALLAHPAVAAAGVAGIPDERWGQVVAAAVVLRSATSADELRDFVRARLAPFKTPRVIWFVDELPMTASGKVRRAELRERFASG